jgi:hypothetical protein
MQLETPNINRDTHRDIQSMRPWSVDSSDAIFNSHPEVFSIPFLHQLNILLDYKAVTASEMKCVLRGTILDYKAERTVHPCFQQLITV